MFQLLYSAAETIAPAAEQAASTPPSLFITIVASAFGGALITSGVTIWAKFAESKAEHKKWLRQEKLKAYSNFSELGYRITSLVTEGKLDEAYENMTDLIFAIAQIRLLAPSQISMKTLTYQSSVRVMFDAAKDNPEDLDSARRNAVLDLDALMITMKTDLSIALHKSALGKSDQITTQSN